MRAVDVIRRKRDGNALSRPEIDFFVAGLTDGSIPDYQAAAWLMAVVWRGMSAEETAWLTEAMVRSGTRADFSDIPRVKAGKHSTGGVGDKVSLVLVPLAAACGLAVPKMSGHALGHTGGTLDKLESIPGFRTTLSVAELHAAVATIGCGLVGHSAEIAPADRLLYGLRDVTATIESVPLISASIMSKKIAEGLDVLVLDVKVGRGAFMNTVEHARQLARSLVETGTREGLRTEAVLTSMDAPLGRSVGNALEVVEAIDTLRGEGPADVEALAVLLTVRLLVLGGVAGTAVEAERHVRTALTSGTGLETFRAMVANQGGDPRAIDDPSRLPSTPTTHVVRAPRAGHVAALDAADVGRAAVALGSGRDRAEASIDHRVGVTIHARPGDWVEENEPVLELHYGDATRLPTAIDMAGRAIEISDEPPTVTPLVLGVVGTGDTST